MLKEGNDKRIGFCHFGAGVHALQEAFPESPILKLGNELPGADGKDPGTFASQVEQLVVAEEVEPILEGEIKAAGIQVLGKEILPRIGELAPQVLETGYRRLLGEAPWRRNGPPRTWLICLKSRCPCHCLAAALPRPPTMCVACPHLGIYYCLSKIRNKAISGDIGCYTPRAGHPWNALDTTICMGASMGVAHGLDKGRTDVDGDQKIIAVIGDSTFMHMGMQGLRHHL